MREQLIDFKEKYFPCLMSKYDIEYLKGKKFYEGWEENENFNKLCVYSVIPEIEKLRNDTWNQDAITRIIDSLKRIF